MIAAHRLTRVFGRFRAVDAVEFDIPKGNVVGFLGPNGAGKTTTIRMIAGFLPPTSGEVVVDDLPVWRNRRKVQARIGYLPEAAPLYPEMRVEEYLRFRCRLFSVPRRRRRAAIDLAVRRCWLQEARRRPIQQLSKGFRQRVGLAAALLHDPPVLILDEPTVGLDPAQIREVRKLIRELAGEHTILLSTHILPEVEQTCDRIVMISRGKVRRAGTVEQLRAEASSVPRYVVETDLPDAATRLRTLENVTLVETKETGGPWRRHTVTAGTKAGDLREPMARALAGGVVRELRREADSLEQLFMTVVGEEAGPVPTVADGSG